MRGLEHPRAAQPGAPTRLVVALRALPVVPRVEAVHRQQAAALGLRPRQRLVVVQPKVAAEPDDAGAAPGGGAGPLAWAARRVATGGVGCAAAPDGGARAAGAGGRGRGIPDLGHWQGHTAGVVTAWTHQQ